MSIDIDNVEFTSKTKYHKEIHYSKNNWPNHFERIDNLPFQVDGNYPDNIFTNELVSLSLLGVEPNPNLSADSSLNIERLTQEISKLELPSAKNHFSYTNLDDQFRQINFDTFQKINRINFSDLESKKSLKEIKIILHDLAVKYFHDFLLAEHFSLKQISDDIEKINLLHKEDVIEELERFGRLNESIFELKTQLSTLFDYIGNVRSIENPFLNKFNDLNLRSLSFTTDELLDQIERKRFISKRDFFSDYKEKRIDQSIIQTINSLYIYELNKLKQVLNLLKDKLNEVHFYLDEFCDDANSVQFLPNLSNKKIVIFTCSYGNGHKVTAAGIRQILQKELAHCVVYDLSTGLFLGKDRWRQLFNFFGVYYDDHPMSGVDVFNEILRRQLYFVINTKDAIEKYVRKMLDITGKDGITPRLGIMKNSWEKTQVRELLFTERPDHIITTYHMDLNPIIEVAEEMGIPILHIPTDYNMKFWEVFDSHTPEYTHFKSLVPNYAVEETLQTQMPLSSDQLIKQIGIPLRPEFYRSLNQDDIKRYRQSRLLADDEKVLFLSTGGNGQNLPHPELLANSPTWDIPLRVLMIVGKNRDFAAHLQQNLTPLNGNPLLLKGKNPMVTIEIISNPDNTKVGTEAEFFIQADELSRLLDISDVSIAKAGGISVAELLFKGVPILFDHRINPFTWEYFNMEVVINRGLGISNYYIESLESDLRKILNVPRKRIENFYFEQGRELFIQLVADQIYQAESDVNLIKRRAHLL